jgi:glutathione synthase/RimK-type ligase-like ATP-grasp enzyme
MVVFRGKIAAFPQNAFFASKYLSRAGIPFMNDYRPYRSRSKVGQAITFYELNLPFAATLYCEDQDALLSAAKERLEYPLIAKDSHGSHGDLNFLVKSEVELRGILQQHKDTDFILQPFIPNDCDYRILVAGNKELIIKRSAQSDTHLNNTSQGGKADLVRSEEFPAEVIKQAHMLAKNLHMEISGIDVLEDSETHEMLFLEANSQPQLVTGAFLDEKAALMKEYFAASRPV